MIDEDRDFYIVVRGGIYKVDLNMWKCNSIYWPSQGELKVVVKVVVKVVIKVVVMVLVMTVIKIVVNVL